MPDNQGLDRIRRRTIATILAVNDTCPDDNHKKAMRATVYSAVNNAFRDVERAINDNQTDDTRGTSSQKSRK